MAALRYSVLICIKRFHKPWAASSYTIPVPKAEVVIKPTLKYFYHFWSLQTGRILVANCVLPATVCGVSLWGMFSWAALSPVQSCLLFSFMKINETVQSSAEASRALLTEEAFGLRQAFPARCHGSSERVRENIASQCCCGMTIGKGLRRGLLMQNANHSNVVLMCCMKDR